MAKRKTRPARRSAVKKKPSTSTALARRAKTAEVVHAGDVGQLEARTVQSGIQVGALGLVELKLTAAEEKVLSKPVPTAEIKIKPTAHAQPYLSHPTYTRWFGEAFGRLGWALVPVGTPTLDPGKRCVVQPYILHIHGKPVAYAMGEQEYFEGNREQTYGDALESTVANALRRCAKRLGVGLEMWDRDFLDEWVARNCVRVKVKGRDGKISARWRRKVDPPFPFEVGRDAHGDPRDRSDTDDGNEQRGAGAPRTYSAPRDQGPSGHHSASGQKITQPQRQRLFMITKNSGRTEDQVRDWLRRRYGYTSTAEIKRSEYDHICDAIESPADLPMTSERQ